MHYYPLPVTSHPQARSGHWMDLKGCSRNWIVLSILVVVTLFVYLPFTHLAPRKPITFVWPVNQTRNATILLQTYKSTTILRPSGVCVKSAGDNQSDRKEEIFLLVVVCSAVQNFEERQVIRDTWAKDQEILRNVKVIFLIGQLRNETFQSNVSTESQTYGDVLQEGFIDSYANLTLKSVMLLKWFSMECDHIPYVLKTDDDMYINLKELFQLTVANKKPNLLVGSLICGAVPIRDPYNKWYCPEYMFDKRVYPNYLSGTSYLMSRSTALTLYEASMKIFLFHLEDIYVTGILSEQVSIRPEDHVGFSFIKRKMSVCLFSQTIASHYMSMPEITEIYKKLNDPNEIKICPTLKPKQLRTYGPGKCRWKT